MKKDISLTLKDKDALVGVCKALSSSIRIDILSYLSKKPAIVTDVAAEFNIPASSAALYIKSLENAGLISAQTIPGSKGSQKLCGVLVDGVDIRIFPETAPNQPGYLYREAMPVGCYFDYKATPSCGIVSETNALGPEDDTGLFLCPDRFRAQLIWLSSGYLEYYFSNTFLKSNHVNRVKFSFEICSEALGYNNNWPSDVTLSLNGQELGMIRCEGDYGGRKGKLNPSWWNSNCTQYGLLHTAEITSDGCYIDGIQVSGETLFSLGLLQTDKIRLRLEVKEDAEFCGGFNLFGEKFGDYPQNLVMEFYNN